MTADSREIVEMEELYAVATQEIWTGFPMEDEDVIVATAELVVRRVLARLREREGAGYVVRPGIDGAVIDAKTLGVLLDTLSAGSGEPETALRKAVKRECMLIRTTDIDNLRALGIRNRLEAALATPGPRAEEGER